MKISVDGGSFKVAIETEFDNLIEEATVVFHQTRGQAGSNEKAILRFLQIIIEHSEEDDAIGYAVLGLLGWYNETITPVTDKNIELNLPKILPHLINPTGDISPSNTNVVKH